MVSSLDGFIAAKDGSIAWMQSDDTYERGVTLTEEYVADFLRSIDCYVMGSRTYEHALELGWAYGDTPVFVLTHRDLMSDKETVEFYSGDLDKLVNDLLKPNFRNIWVVGGSLVVNSFIISELADDIVISVMPVVLGNGTRFFDYFEKQQQLHLKDVTAYKDGMVELRYEVKKE